MLASSTVAPEFAEKLNERLSAMQLRHLDAPVSGGAVRAASEEEAIRAALERTNYNRLAAARELGMHKSTLFRKMKKLDLDLPPMDGRSRRRTP